MVSNGSFGDVFVCCYEWVATMQPPLALVESCVKWSLHDAECKLVQLNERSFYYSPSRYWSPRNYPLERDDNDYH